MKTGETAPEASEMNLKAPKHLSKAFPRCDHSPKVYPNSSRAQIGLSCRFTSHNQTDVLNFQSFSLFDSSFHILVFPSFCLSIFFPSFFHLFFVFSILPLSHITFLAVFFFTVIVRTSSLRPSAPHFFSASTPVSTASPCAPSRAHIPLFFPVSSFLHM